MWLAFLGDHGPDAVASAPPTDAGHVVGHVPRDGLATATRRIDHRLESSGLVGLPGGDLDGQGHALSIGHQVKFATFTPS